MFNSPFCFGVYSTDLPGDEKFYLFSSLDIFFELLSLVLADPDQ